MESFVARQIFTLVYLTYNILNYNARGNAHNGIASFFIISQIGYIIKLNDRT